MAVVGASMVLAVGPDTVEPGDVDRFALDHALTALPFLVAGLAAGRRAQCLGPTGYRPFWQRWQAATFLSLLATLAAIVGGAAHIPAFLALDLALLVAAMPLWVSATVLMAREQAGRRSVSVDVVDAATALVLLGVPGVLLVIEPLTRTENPVFALPLAVSAVIGPGSVYLSLLNVARIPAGERAAHGIGAVLAGVATVNLTLQVAWALGGLDLPLRVFIGGHVLTLVLLTATPLFAHRQAVGWLARLPDHRQVRRSSPMPYVSAATLPLLGAYVFLTRDDRPWGVWFFLVVVLVVVALNAVRHTVMSRETSRLHAGIARMAEERRRLLTRLLRGLEDDRHRTATELHSQAVGSLATLGTLVQMAQVALPGDSATTVRQTVAGLQSDLGTRAEHLRRLMLAIRPPAAGDGDGDGDGDEIDDDGLAAALLAYAAEQWRDGPTPDIGVAVDPELRLDWTTTTLVYRLAQEALRNVARHAHASAVAVTVADADGRVLLEVSDDGVGFDTHRVPQGSGLALMEGFARLTIRSQPGEGTLVRCLLPGDAGDRGTPRRRHLRVV